MHPRVFLEGFWRMDLRDEVFVAMSFRPDHDPRWDRTFKPAIEMYALAGRMLRALRVDYRNGGDSIHTSIVDGVSHSQLVLADVSVIPAPPGEAAALHNANVLFEVGLAVAIRQPCEVVLVADKASVLKGSVLFDVSHLPITPIDFDDSVAGQGAIRKLLEDRLAERQLERDLRLTRARASLGQFEVNLIRQNWPHDQLAWTGSSLPPAVALALPDLLRKGILRLGSVRPDGAGV